MGAAVLVAVAVDRPADPASTGSAADPEVSVLPLDPAADPQLVVDSCARLMPDLPHEVAGLTRVAPVPESNRTAAWGADPLVALRCGVPLPPGFVQGQTTVEVDGVQWYQQLDGPVVTWTTVDRAVRVQVLVPTRVTGQGAVLTALGAAVVKDLPAARVDPFPLPSREPVPGG